MAGLASPVYAKGEKGTGGSSGGAGDGGKVFALSFSPGGASPSGRGSTCAVGEYDGDRRFYIFSSVDENGVERVAEYVVDNSADNESINDRVPRETESEVVTNDTDGDGEVDTDEAAPNSELVDPSDSEPTSRGNRYGTFTADLEDGRFDVDGEAWGVWRVICDPEKEDEFNIVSAPLSPQGLISPVLDYLEDYLPEPELSLEPFDDERDWTYVQTALDFRTPPDTLEPVVLTADTGGPDEIRQWITVTAVPSKVVFDSGDSSSDESVVECPASNADDPYVAEEPGACSHTFRNSSSIADNGVFETELSIVWDVTFLDSDGGTGTLPAAPTVYQEDVAVAEIKVVNVPNKPK